MLKINIVNRDHYRTATWTVMIKRLDPSNQILNRKGFLIRALHGNYLMRGSSFSVAIIRREMDRNFFDACMTTNNALSRYNGSLPKLLLTI